jgi:hypothetical protein
MAETLGGITVKISPPLLRDFGLLFDTPAGARLPNGHLDTGWNCHAKAYVTVYLARLQGIAADYCEGRAYAVARSGNVAPAFLIDPHGWAGVDRGVVDLSGRELFGHRHYTVGHDKMSGMVSPRVGHVRDAADFSRLRATRARLAPGNYLFFFEHHRRAFDFYSLHHGVNQLNSKPSRQLLSGFRNGDQVLAKAILHLHRITRGERHVLHAATQLDAWTEVARMEGDAMAELEVIWQLAWRGRTVPVRAELPTAGPHWTEYLSG